MSWTLNAGLMASNYAGNTKKSTASGICFAGWATGLIAGPRKYPAPSNLTRADLSQNSF